ncbi:LacI family transcriptional regulator [Kitasatospora sp. RB6PN24]|uniref:LacI family DNA-binding transcriptional regulator n=1 Tax=Kitasatospora humi TaxID=2893891 RepID=UPI001E4881BA|nr:LacI family DNA-binding transcriptional regulator [Kitasatospora humi]MCC9306026.1 LacI family transcriptional regulator [Kitasatospora humi]
MVTMQDVAERAGVTKQTVSNVIRGRNASPATAARVRAAIEELGYTPNLVARSLATGATMTVGLLVPTVVGSFYAGIVEEVEDVLDENGYHLLLCTTRLDGDRAKRHLAGLTSRSVDALLVAGDRDLIDHLPLLTAASFPVALCAWETDAPDRFPVVTIDYERAGYLAGRHLRELGHEHVAVLASPDHTPRVAGFRRAFAADGLTLPDAAVHLAAEPTLAGGFAATAAALLAAPGTTAVFATHDVDARARGPGLAVLPVVHRWSRSRRTDGALAPPSRATARLRWGAGKSSLLPLGIRKAAARAVRSAAVASGSVVPGGP